MKNEPTIKWIPLIIGLLPISTILCCIGFFIFTNNDYIHRKALASAYLQEIAQSLGNTPQTELVQDEVCWDDLPWLLGGNCGVFLVLLPPDPLLCFSQQSKLSSFLVI